LSEQCKKMLELIKNFIKKVFRDLFRRKKNLKIGLYGPPNGGKTTLANRICKDWLGEEMGTASNVAHETREIQLKEQVTIKSEDGKELTFSLVDTPGIATKIDYEDFVKKGIKKKDAKERAKEATKGVIDAIKWLDEMDVVIVVLDATKDPYTQVNITIIGNLQARDIPVLLVGNKTDLKKADNKRLEAAFPQYDIVGISAKKGTNIEQFYEGLFAVAG
jgi:GTPase